MRLEWLQRMMDAIDRIERGMEERFDIEEIAKAACVSPFHFQRMFLMLTGMTVGEYVRKRRLTLAAQELATSSVKVIDVALKFGYESPEAFAKAFRKVHGVSPSEARAPGVRLKAFPRISFHLSLKGDKDMDYRMVDREAFDIVGKVLSVSCKDGENLRRIPQFWAECDADGTVARLVSIAEDDELLGVCMDMQPSQEEFKYMIACRGGAAGDLPDGWERRTVPASTWAVFTSVGPMPNAIQDLFARIFQEWFPATGYEHTGAPEMEVYPPGDPNDPGYRTEVWIPIAKK